MENNNLTLGLFCDMSKAFDTVSHKILLNKLENYGIRGIALRLIKSYLSDRLQCVRVNSALSDYLSVTKGVPQGSILGPILFLVYVNDLIRIYPDAKYALYADDSNIFVTGTSVSQINSKVQPLLNELSSWCSANKLMLNPAKTVAIIFRAKNRRLDSELNCTLNSVRIEPVNETKFLGVWLDEHLTWKKHIFELTVKLRKICGIVNRYRNVFPFKVKRMIYYALFYSSIHYCSLVYSTATKGYIDAIVLLQKRFLRIMYNLDMRCSVNNLFEQCGILQVHKLYTTRILKIFKSKNNVIKQNLFDLANIERRSTHRSLRISVAYKVPMPVREYSKQKLAFMLPKILNSYNLDNSLTTS